LISPTLDVRRKVGLVKAATGGEGVEHGGRLILMPICQRSTVTIEESVSPRGRTENAGHVGVEDEWS
jgi:hypothetical protein